MHIFYNLKLGINKRTILELLFIVFMSFITVACLVFLNKTYGLFYDALNERNGVNSMKYIVLYIALTLVNMLCDSEIFIRKKFFSIHFRDTIYNYYNTNVLDDKKVEYSCQRMSQDLMQFPMQFIDLFVIFIHSCLLIPAFLYILISLKLSIYTIFTMFAIVVIGMIIGKLISKPIVTLQYKQESLEADLRRKLIVEIEKTTSKSLPSIKEVKENYTKLSTKERCIIYFKNLYTGFYHSFPYVVVLPEYLKYSISLGVLVQSGVAMTKLMKEISFFIDNLDKLVEFRATNRRINELKKLHNNY